MSDIYGGRSTFLYGATLPFGCRTNLQYFLRKFCGRLWYTHYRKNLIIGEKYMKILKKMNGVAILRILLVGIGSVAFLLFVVPLSLTVGLNIGNVTGIAVAIIMVVYGLFFWRINAFRRNLKKRKFLRVAAYFADGMIIVIGVLTILLTSLMIHAANNEPTGKETLIVLGCRVYGEKPSLSLRERLDAAYEYLAENPEAYCVVSGGQGFGENISEAECMYRYLINKGIDHGRIYKEDASASTRENLEYSLQVIKENNLPDEIAIATSEYHQYRVGLIAKGVGVENTAVCGKTARWLLPTFYVRELYGILYEWVF